MQAIDKISSTNNWVILVMLFLFFVIFALRTLSYVQLKNQFFALFNISTIEDDVETDNELSLFQILFFVFNVTLFAMLFFQVKTSYKAGFDKEFYNFTTVFFGLLVFFITKKGLEQLLLTVFGLRRALSFFMVTKKETLNSFGIIHFVALTALIFGKTSINYILIFLAILLLYRFILIILKNNNLIFSRLFYFILYLCAFEIAPLFILFKMMF